MGKRVAASNTKTSIESSTQFTPPQTRTTIRKRKYQIAAISSSSIAKSSRLNSSTANANGNCSTWHENDDEDSSSNEAQQSLPRHQSNKRVNNATVLLNSPTISCGNGDHNATTESPKPVYTLRPSVVNGTILYDLTRKPWRLGRPIGKGNFGEIFLASDNITIPVTNENAKFVVKIEPHSNGPLFVEIHCLMNTAKKKPDITCSQRQRHRMHSDHHDIEDDNDDDDDEEEEEEDDDDDDDDSNGESVDAALVPQIPPSGIPDYIASGSHYFGDARYRFLVLPRFDRDLHSLIKNCRVHQKSVLTLAIQVINVLENLHDKGYCHNDVKAQNLMISKCKYYKRKLTTTTTTTTIGNGNKTKSNVMHKKKYDDNYEEKLPTTDSGNSSEQETNDDNAYDTDFVIKRNAYRRAADDDDDEEEEDEEDGDDDDDDDEDFDDGATSNSNNSNSRDEFKTPVNRKRKGRPRKNVVEFSGSNPVRSCRRQKRNLIYEEMVSSHYLRPAKRVSYSEFFYEDGVSVKDDSQDTNFSSGDELESSAIRRTISNTTRKKTSNTGSARLARRQTRRQERLGEKRNNVATTTTTTTTVVPELIAVEEERIFLIDFGLASKFRDNGIHRPFVMDQRRAHDGTLEFTSRDAHMGAHSRRSDLECLGYNLLYWSQGYLPWKDAAHQHQQEKVHRAKEYLMTDVRELLKQIYGKQIPKYLGEFLHQVGQLAYHERPDYARYRRIFEREFQQLGYALNELRLDSEEIARTSMRVKEEIENKNDVFDMSKSNHNAWSIMSNLSVTTPFQERTLSNRVSPKNLRSKSDKKTLKKKKFSWAEVLSQDPDQIARERAEKEFDREEELSDVQHPTIRRYEGKPTYAILEIQQRLRISGRFVEESNRDRDNVKLSLPDQKDNNEEDDDEEEASANDNDEQNENDDEEIVEEDDEEDETERMEISEGSDEDADDQNEVAMQNNSINEEDESDKNGNDSDTDASEVSSVHVRLRHCGAGRPRKDAGRNEKQIKSKMSSSSKKTTCKATSTTTVTSYGNINEGASKRKNKRVTVAFTTKTRSSSANTTTFNMERSSRKHSKTSKTTTSTNPTMRMYRGEAENLGRGKVHAASAAGEIEQNKHNNYRRQEDQQQHYNRHHHKSDLKYCENISQQQINERGRVRTLERRTRRCLIKTDVDTEESNSNFSPDVRSLFNVWKKFNQH